MPKVCLAQFPLVQWPKADGQGKQLKPGVASHKPSPSSHFLRLTANILTQKAQTAAACKCQGQLQHEHQVGSWGCGLGRVIPTKSALLSAAGRKRDTRASAAKTIVPNSVLTQSALGCQLERKIPCSVIPGGFLDFNERPECTRESLPGSELLQDAQGY